MLRVGKSVMLRPPIEEYILLYADDEAVKQRAAAGLVVYDVYELINFIELQRKRIVELYALAYPNGEPEETA